MSTKDIDHVQVGKLYRGSMVENIDKEIKKMPTGQVRVRKSIHLDTGMIMIEDTFHEENEIFEEEKEYPEMPYHEIEGPKGIDLSSSDNKKKEKKRKKKEKEEKERAKREREEAEAIAAAEEAAKREAEELARKEAEEKAQKEAQEKARLEAEAKARREAEAAEAERLAQEEAQRKLQEEEARKKAEEEEARKKAAAAEEAKKKAAEEKLRASQAAMLERKKKADARRASQIKEKEEMRKRASIIDAWKPHTTWIYSNPDDATVDAPDFFGVWKYSTGDEDDNQNWLPQEVVIHPPGKDPELVDTAGNGIDSGIPHGVWGYFPGTDVDSNGLDWKPTIHKSQEPAIWLCPPGIEPSTDLGEVQGKWSFPKKAKWPPPTKPVHKPRRCVVYNRFDVPDDVEDGKIGGVWKVGKLPIERYEKWEAQNVSIYDNGDEPPSLQDSKIPHGKWGLAPDAKPDADGNVSPKDKWFFAPGDEPDDDGEWQAKGVWAFGTDEDDDDQEWQWPPPCIQPQETPKPKECKIYTSKNVPKTSDGTGVGGVWKFDAGEDWDAQDAWIYNAGDEPATLEGSNIPHGKWGFAPNAEPDENGNFSPQDTWFFAPGEEPNDDNDDGWQAKGTWALGVDEDDNEEFQWPPQPIKEDEPKPAMVFSDTTAPGSQENTLTNGVWKSIDSDSLHGYEDWKPQAVWIYKDGEPEDLDESSPYGVWGFAPGAAADDEGKYEPQATWFYVPGESPKEDEWQHQGTWTAPGATWPPEKEKKSSPSNKSSEPKVATVFPEKKASKQSADSQQPKGMWKYSPGKKVMDAGKKPQEVLMYDEGSVPKGVDTSNGGKWGYAPGTEPDADGNWNPNAVWFVAPNETPPDDWQPQGTWVFKDVEKQSPKKKSPKKSSPKKSQSPSKERVRAFQNSAFVYPSASDAPGEGDKHNIQGIWAVSPGKQKNNEPLELLLHKPGEEPSSFAKGAHGVWGHRKDAVPDENGVFQPKDLLFFPPGHDDDTPEDFVSKGSWSYPESRIEETVTWRFEGADMVYYKKTEIHFMDTVTTFEKEVRRE